ncbi:MAG: DNA-binding response regulator [Gemmatimonadota bacterium]
MIPRRLRVALVDDHVLVLQAIADMVAAEADLEVVATGATADEALSLLDAHGPDVLVLDLALGDDGGLDLVRRISRRHPGVSIVVLSMFPEEVFAERALRAGAVGYVMKDQAPEALLEAIRSAGAGQIHVSPRLRQQAVQRLTGRPGVEHGVDDLTDRELDVFRLVGEGLTSREIAARLGLSVKTVETHRTKVMRKLGLENAHQLVHRAILWIHRSIRMP